jgi:hypothetical protein
MVFSKGFGFLRTNGNYRRSGNEGKEECNQERTVERSLYCVSLKDIQRAGDFSVNTPTHVPVRKRLKIRYD